MEKRTFKDQLLAEAQKFRVAAEDVTGLAKELLLRRAAMAEAALVSDCTSHQLIPALKERDRLEGSAPAGPA